MTEQRNAVAVGVDGSPASMAALEWAAAEAERRRAPLRLVHAREPMPTPDHAREGVEERQARELQDFLDRARDQTVRDRPGLDVTAEVVAGEPESVLHRIAGESAMLVLGSYGTRRKLPSFFLGSTSLSTVARADHPVVLVRATQEPNGSEAPQRAPAEDEGREAGSGTEAGEQVHPHGPRLVVGLGLRHTYENLLRFAFESAQATGLPLHVVHALRLPPHVYVPGGPVVPHMAVEHRREVEQEIRELVRPWAERYPDIDLHAALRIGSTAQTVVREAEGSDLLVVGRCRKHRTPVGPRIGPVAHAAVHHAACPVAVIPHD